MLKLTPIKSEKIWGYELWIASTHPNGCQEDFKQLCGGDFPLLVKIIQANDTLSIQVHPDDEAALQLEGPGNRGKTECWYVLDAAPGSKIVYGLKEGAKREQLEQAIQNSVLDPFLNYVEVHTGDFVYIPAGTVHAICGGLRLLEVQQSCDLTYRLYDWGRGREVHIQKGLEVIKTKDMIPPSPFSGQFECPYFNLERKDVRGGWSMYNSEGIQLIYVISSEKAVIRGPGDKFGKTIYAEDIYAVVPGDKITIEGKASIIKIKS